jgi:hypothetical protein
MIQLTVKHGPVNTQRHNELPQTGVALSPRSTPDRRVCAGQVLGAGIIDGGQIHQFWASSALMVG